MVKWAKTRYTGVRSWQSETRKYRGRPDRCFVVRYKRHGKTITETVGWQSEGFTQEFCSNLRGQIVANIKTGQGHAKAQHNLGYMYGNGKGVLQDYIQAHKWFNLSASRSQGKLHEESVQNRDVSEQRMTPAQVAEAQKLAREWKPKPAQ